MAASTQLFDLIKTLNKSEKRFFKLHCSKYTSKNSYYQKVFDAIDKQQEYDEAALKSKFAKQQFVKQFHVIKNYLYNLILDSLHAYNAGKTVDLQIVEYFQKSDILQDKGLYVQALKMLNKAKKLAETHDRLEYALQIYKREKILYIRKLDALHFAKRLDEFVTKERETIALINNLFEYEWISNDIFKLYYKVLVARTQIEADEYRAVLSHPLLKQVDTAKSFRAKMHFYNVKAVCYEGIGELQACCDHRAKLVELFEEHPMLIKADLLNYIKALNNLLYTHNELRDYDTFYEVLTKLKTIPQVTRRKLADEEAIMIFRACYAMEYNVHIKTGKFREAVASIPKIEAGFERFGEKLGEHFRFPFYYFFAYAHFAVGNYQTALTYLDHLINNTDTSFKHELFRFGRILFLLAHHELGNYELIPSLLRSTRRYLSTMQRPYKTEQLILRFLKKVPYADEEAAYRQLKSQFEVISRQLQFHIEFEHFDFLTWVESKLRKEQFEIVYLEQVKDAKNRRLGK